MESHFATSALFRFAQAPPDTTASRPVQQYIASFSRFLDRLDSARWTRDIDKTADRLGGSLQADLTPCAEGRPLQAGLFTRILLL